VESELAGENFIYALEPLTGIARARNMAVEQALSAGAAAVLFADDDEAVDADWLRHLVAAWQAGRGDILGGPVRVKFEPGPKTDKCRFLERGLTQRFDRRAARKARQRVNVPVCTNNCLIDSAVFTASSLRFDTTFLSGEDRELFRQATARGYRAGWVPEAIVHETWPAERVNFSYFFFRGGIYFDDHISGKCLLAGINNFRTGVRKLSIGELSAITSLRFN
jgi:GT2 family glycosyltransferase